MAKYRLTYFDGRGLAECTRYLLTLGGADWEDNRMSITFAPDGNHVRPEFNALKEAGALPFGQVRMFLCFFFFDFKGFLARLYFDFDNDFDDLYLIAETCASFLFCTTNLPNTDLGPHLGG